MTILWICFLHYRMPILYNNISGGRFLCALFFICISLAGFSSMVSLMERTIRVAIDYGSTYVCTTNYYSNLKPFVTLFTVCSKTYSSNHCYWFGNIFHWPWICTQHWHSYQPGMYEMVSMLVWIHTHYQLCSWILYSLLWNVKISVSL